MIKLTINREKKEIPAADELTVGQYIKLVALGEINIVNYLSTVLGINYKEAFNSKVKNLDLLTRRIGQIEDYSKITPKKKITFKDGSFNYIPSEISTVGERWTIEENARELEGEELMIFILAVGLVPDPMNFDKITTMVERLKNEPYKEILPTAFFLHNRFLIGKSTGVSFFHRLILMIKIRKSKNRLILKELHRILITLKYRVSASF